MAARESELKYAGYSRFELELEFVQCLANPLYLQYLASQKLFDDPAFVAYLDYLRYFQRSEYIAFLLYPGPTLKALELVQNEQFRKDILSPETVARMIEGRIKATMGEG